MGLMDSFSKTIDRAGRDASRITTTLRLKGRLGEEAKQRRDLAAQLGEAVYDAMKDDDAFRAAYEDLFAGIAECDRNRADLQAKIDELEAQAAAEAAAAEAAASFACPRCGTTVSRSDLYCSGCGTSTNELKEELEAAAAQTAEAQAQAEEAAEPAGPTCPLCGSPVGEDARFCTTCGTKIERPAKAASPEPPAEPETPAAPEAQVEAE